MSGIQSKYQLLVNSLDSICKNAPSNFSSYYFEGKSEEQINQIRSKAYIHLYLLIKFGVQDFKRRHDLITDGAHDGGVDAYYIDENKHYIYLIQSKYRTSEKNYEEIEIEPDELAAMELKEILSGRTIGKDGNKYNGKIQGMQKAISELRNVGIYRHKIVILANLCSAHNLKVAKALFKDFDFEIFNHERAYKELVLPLCRSTYFQNDKILIEKTIPGKIENYAETFNNTSYKKCSVGLAFVPLNFIAQIVDEYKNSILQYNPRNYLTMSKNPVNKAISEGLANDNDDFALLNNGITMVCSSFSFTTNNGLEDTTTVCIEDPQIINGGQTAFTLSRYRKNGIDALKDKKVLLKLIATYRDQKESSCEKEKLNDLRGTYDKFIYTISDATNKQTRIEEADRRSNLQVQCDLQLKIYDEFGLLYERKTGEFEEVVSNGIIKKEQIIKRDTFIRALLAVRGDCGSAMGLAKDKLFEKDQFTRIFSEEVSPRLAVYAYMIYKHAYKKDTEAKRKESPVWGNATRYGKYALVSAAGLLASEKVMGIDSLDKIIELADKCLTILLSRWKEFEEFAISNNDNSSYFMKEKNYPNYYKSKNASYDVKCFWEKKIKTDKLKEML